jgi:hypothetical protein
MQSIQAIQGLRMNAVFLLVGKKPSAVAKPSRNPTPMGNAKKIESNGKKIEKLMLMLKGKGGKFTDKTAKGLADRPTVPK